MDNPFLILDARLRSIEELLLRIHAEKIDCLQTETYFKVDAAAEFLSTSPTALRVMVTRNQIPHIKKMGKLLFRQSDLINWLEGKDA